MYLKYFGLRKLPFGLTPDTSFAFRAATHQEALNTLAFALNSGEGFIKITGEVGTGKTLLCRRLLQAMGDRYQVAYLPNPDLEPRTLLLAVGEELEADLDPDADQYHLLKALNQRLLDIAKSGKAAVVCIDEAQAMPEASLESLRLLSNLETQKRKLLQWVMFGQPELDEKLAQEGLRQLRQRIAFHYRIQPLGRTEVAAYVAHRLKVAGLLGQNPFSPAALKALAQASGGIPRLVNILGHKTLMSVFGEGRHQALRRHVRDAARDTEGARSIGRWW